jgi:hypothetical protein
MRCISSELFSDASALDQGTVLGDYASVMLFSLGLEPEALVGAASRLAPHGPVALVDSYGIVGFDRTHAKNVELLEKGRGLEYGGVGGDGGSGVVAAFFSGPFAFAYDRLPEGATSHLVALGSDRGTLVAKSSVPYYGGRAKATYRFDPDRQAFLPVPLIAVSTLPSAHSSVGVTSFTSDAKGATSALLDLKPRGHAAQAVALFPCFMRGKNEYGKNDVEPDAISELLPGVPIFGMFCHGELGPKRCLGFDPGEVGHAACSEHSMTSILAVHTAAVG